MKWWTSQEREVVTTIAIVLSKAMDTVSSPSTEMLADSRTESGLITALRSLT